MSGGGQQRADALDQLPRGDALARPHLDLVELSGLVEEPLGGAELECGDLRAPERLDRPVLDDAGDAELAHGPERADADRVARLQALLLCGRAVDGDLPATPRPASLHDGERVEARLGGGVDGECRGAPAALDHLPVLADEPGFVEYRPVGALDLRECADLRQDGGREALGRGLFIPTEALLADDDRVGVRVGVREDRVEALRDRVREDVGAADHRDAEHDRQRGERGTELASGQPLEGDGDHRPLTSSIASRIWWALARPSSFTTWPSARNRIRSAIAAAFASWVTITVVWP
jgi:hypothetical protein